MDFFMASSPALRARFHINYKPQLQTQAGTAGQNRPRACFRRASYHAAIAAARETFRNKSKALPFVSLSWYVTSNDRSDRTSPTSCISPRFSSKNANAAQRILESSNFLFSLDITARFP
jgi:hypothetical protein